MIFKELVCDGYYVHWNGRVLEVFYRGFWGRFLVRGNTLDITRQIKEYIGRALAADKRWQKRDKKRSERLKRFLKEKYNEGL